MAKFGLMQIKSMTALLFVGKRLSNPISITTKSCNGYLKKTFIINAGERCAFRFNSEMTKGSVSVEFFDIDKNPVFTLSDSHKEAVLYSDTKAKYRVIFKFDNASGKFSLGW